MLRRHRIALVVADTAGRWPLLEDLTADFVYLRLMNAKAELPTGYPPEVLASFAQCAQVWADGGEPEGLPRVAGDTHVPESSPRDVFMFMINGAKERAPAAAMGVIGNIRTCE